MKKLSVLLSLLLIFPVFVLSASAVACVNSVLEVEYVKTSPDVDGVVPDGEYSVYPALTYSADTEQFTNDDDHDEYGDWDFDFYISWNETDLSMAWVVKSHVHSTVSENGLDDMWRYSSVRFIVTPGYPEAGLTNYQAHENYLEISICQLDNGDVGTKVFNTPAGVTERELSVYELESTVIRHENENQTVYEVRVPWGITGVATVKHDTEFGITFAVAAQEDYNVKKGAIEWNDAMLGEKNADRAAVITLESGCHLPPPFYTDPIPPEEIQPDDSENTVKLAINLVNKEIAAELSSLQIDRTQSINNKWAYSMLLEPVESKENVYKIVATQQGDGENVTFEDQYKDGMMIFAVHSDGGENLTQKEDAMSLPIGTELTLWGIDVEKQERLYRNAILYVAKSDIPDTDESTDTSDSSDSEESVTCALPNSVPSSDETASEDNSQSKDSSKADESLLESPVFWVIAVGAIAVIAVIVVVIKKRR